MSKQQANTLSATATADNIEARYRRAEALQLGASRATNTSMRPNWIGESDCFWYLRETKEGSEYRLVDAEAASNSLAFDHQSLAQALSEASGESVDANNLPLMGLVFTLSPLQLNFTAFGKPWHYDIASQAIAALEVDEAVGLLSPDGRKRVFRRQYNLWLRDEASGEETPLTTDGKAHYVYACLSSAYGRRGGLSLDVLWSPDSKRLFTVISDALEVAVAPPLVRHVPPPEAGLRPDIVDPDRRAGWPGDEHIEGFRFVAFDVDTGERRDADYRLVPAFYPCYVGVVASGLCWWGEDNRRAYFIDYADNGKTARLVECDTHTGTTRVIIDETSTNRINLIPLSHVSTLVIPLAGGKEVLWYSEQSGWAHLYRYNLETGELLNPVTEGEWVVRNVLHYDAEQQELLIQTAGRVAGRNPYYRDICRVNVETGALTPLISTDDEYYVCDTQAWGSFLKGVSPSGRVIVTTRSRVDSAPVSLLLDRQGNTLLELEQADTSAMPSGWQWPEPVQVKAADGNTDLYGVLFRPPNFDKTASYPVIDCSSYVDFIPSGSFSNEAFAYGGHYNTANVFAELGFIVVMIRCRGTGQRSKAFDADKDSPLLYNTHQDDAIAGIQQLAERYPYIDTRRVGLAGYPGAAAVVSGLLRYPDFYSVGVSNGSFIDARLLPNNIGDMTAEGQLLSESIQPQLHMEDSAKNLKGKLLLIHGMLDNAAPVSQVFRLVEALQLANKDFDMLLLPNLGHGDIGSGGRYVLRRTWDYYVQHLLGIEPPREIELSAQFELGADPTLFCNLSLADENKQ